MQQYSTTTPPAIASALDRVQALYHGSLYLKAWQAAQEIGPLRQWTGVDALLIGGRLAGNIGASRLRLAMHRKAFSQNPTHPEAIYYYAWALLDWERPWSTWRYMKRQGELPDAPKAIRADWLAMHAHVLWNLRDFDAADDWMKRALDMMPDRAWLHVERTYLLEAEDRYPEALEAAQEALRLRPFYRPAVQHAAHLLTLLNRDDEAIKLLTDATQNIESASVWAQLGTINSERGDHLKAIDCYKKYIEYSPMLEDGAQNGMNCTLSDEHYLSGNLAQAAEHAKKVERSQFWSRIAERLGELVEKPELAAARKRVLLPVAFVRQHHLTCVPATLTAIGRFWAKQVDHLELAEALCYDGVSNHNERNWAQTHGWVVREFTITWDAIVALIDRGIPFTLTTREATYSHLQAVIGYDTFRSTILVRDPYLRHVVEFHSESFFERYNATGPRGMALVPEEKASLLDGLTLPDNELHNQIHEMNSALEKHDRSRAQVAFDQLSAKAPDHILTIQTRRSLAMYDGDQTALLAATERALKLFPENPALLISKLFSLRHYNRRDERLTLLKEICALGPPETEDDKGKGLRDPIFLEYYAQELRADAREHETTRSVLRRSIRWRPGEASLYSLLADVLWDCGKFEESVDLYRFAACLRDKEERFQRSYFIAMRFLRREDAALQLIQNRVQRTGKKSGLPAQTLHWALDQLDRDSDAMKVLDEAMTLRPDDAELMLYAAEAYATSGKLDRTDELLAKAETHAQKGAWLRTAAMAARMHGDLARARECWQQIVQTEPLSMDAHRALTQLTAETQGREAAIAQLRASCEKFASNFPLHQLLTEWLRDDRAQSEPVLRRLIEIDSADGWARRELALCLSDCGRHEEALAEAKRSLELEPRIASSHGILGDVLLKKGDLAGAREHYRQAITLAIDYEHAIHQLVSCCSSPAEAREALEFIHREIVRQTNYGDGLFAFRDKAASALDAETLLKFLKEAHTARPDLWHAWSVLIQQLCEMNKLDEADTISRQATERFTLIARIWIDRANVARLINDRDGREFALRMALEISPSWGYAARELAQVFEDELNFPPARKVLESAIARAPLDPYNHSCLAALMWKMGERAPAIEKMKHAIRLQPDYPWAWDALHAWSEDTGAPMLAPELARELTKTRAGDPASWLTLARVLVGREHLAERLAALEKSIELSPRNIRAHDIRATLLTDNARFDEAIAACRHPVWKGEVPLSLRGREAWVDAERNNFAAASEKMRAILKEDPNYVWGWRQLAEWCNNQGDLQGALAAAENVVRILPAESESYGYRSIARQKVGDRDGAYADLKRALELQPNYLWAARALCDMYLDDGKLKEAEQVIVTARTHSPTDAFSIARQAQIEARLNKPDAVLTRLKELLDIQADDSWPLEAVIEALCKAGRKNDAVAMLTEKTKAAPDYFNAWKQLADLQDRGDKKEYRRAAEAMVRIRPTSEIAHGYLAYICREMKDLKEAQTHFKTAFGIDPRYAYAGHQLFDMQLDDGNLNDAAETLATLRRFHSDPPTLAGAVTLAARRKNLDEAMTAFRELCSKPSEYRRSLNNAMEEILKRGWEKDALAILRDAAKSSQNQFVGAVFIERLAAGGRWKEIEPFVDALDWSSKSGAQSIEAMLQSLHSNKQSRLFRKFIEKNREKLRDNTRLWGSTGYAFTEFDDHAGTVEWLADWPQRKDALPWMLSNAAWSLRGLGRDAEAAKVSEHALTLESDHATGLHLLWLAWDAALAGNYDAASKHVEKVTVGDHTAFYQGLEAMVRALLEIQNFTGANAQQAYISAKKRLDQSLLRNPKGMKDSVFRRYFVRTARRIADSRGGFMAKLWYVGQWLRQYALDQ